MEPDSGLFIDFWPLQGPLEGSTVVSRSVDYTYTASFRDSQTL